MGFYRSVKQFNFANEPIKIAEKMIKTLSWNYLLVLYAAYNCKHFRTLFTIEATCINPEQTAPKSSLIWALPPWEIFSCFFAVC